MLISEIHVFSTCCQSMLNFDEMFVGNGAVLSSKERKKIRDNFQKFEQRMCAEFVAKCWV